MRLNFKNYIRTIDMYLYIKYLWLVKLKIELIIIKFNIKPFKIQQAPIKYYIFMLIFSIWMLINL